MLKKIKLKDAVGTKLAHDITEIRPGEFKGRILGHSHVDEQPFSRSGGGVVISVDTEVIVRAHMYPSGYGEGLISMKGSVANGFKPYNVAADFGTGLEKVDPQPTGCAF